MNQREDAEGFDSAPQVNVGLDVAPEDKITVSGCATDGEENLADDISKCESIIEAVLFAAGHPVEYTRLADSMNIPLEFCRKIVSDYAEKYNGGGGISRGIMLVQFPDACQICTREEYGSYIRTALGIRRGGNLSNSSLEVLAIVAYNQPVTRAFVDTVRGVDSSYAISSMCDKKLIEPCGRLDVPGRPMLYRTTDNFLRVFGLDSLRNLPPIATEDGSTASPPDADGSQISINITEDGEKGDQD